MMKHIFPSAFLFCLLFLMISCGGNKYGDLIELNEKIVQLTEEYVASLEKASNADEITATMNRFADSMETLGPKMKEMADKYPELKNKNDQPEELKPYQEKAEEVSKKFQGTIMKIMPHMNDPEVKATFKRVSKAIKAIS